jgi:hypothetical protein
LSLNANLNKNDFINNISLLYNYNKKEIICLLIENKVIINLINEIKATPFYFTIKYRDKIIVYLLIECSVYINSLDGTSRSLLYKNYSIINRIY